MAEEQDTVTPKPTSAYFMFHFYRRKDEKKSVYVGGNSRKVRCLIFVGFSDADVRSQLCVVIDFNLGGCGSVNAERRALDSAVR